MATKYADITPARMFSVHSGARSPRNEKSKHTSSVLKAISENGSGKWVDAVRLNGGLDCGRIAVQKVTELQSPAER
jgi:hypothetical protein